MLPFQYAIRNLLRDPGRFALKSLGSCFVVFLIFGAGSFNQGMDNMLAATGSPSNIIFIGAGSEESVERSEVPIQAEVQIAAAVRNIQENMGTPAVSGEVQYMGMLSTEENEQKQVYLRGVTVNAFQVHNTVRIIKGNFPRTGEVMIGRLTHKAMDMDAAELQIGDSFEFEGEKLTISGIFDAPGTVLESEVWMNRTDLMTLTQRDSLSCVVVKMIDTEQFPVADLFAKQRLDLELVAISEIDYYAKLSSFFAPIKWMTWLTTGLVAIGAIFGGLNMLYAAFASRIRELATLQTIGFSRISIFISLVQESLLTTLFGTMLASILALVLLEGKTVYFAIGTFSLNMHTELIFLGIFSGIILGLIGAVAPAIRCLGAALPSALRSS